MRINRMIAPAVLLALVATACASTTRAPLEGVPSGNYVLVEPESDVYNAVSINERAFTVRLDDQVYSGEHWVDAEGRLHMTEDEGPCAGEESIWTYDYANNRVTLDLVEDRCEARTTPYPERMVYERS